MFGKDTLKNIYGSWFWQFCLEIRIVYSKIPESEQYSNRWLTGRILWREGAEGQRVRAFLGETKLEGRDRFHD